MAETSRAEAVAAALERARGAAVEAGAAAETLETVDIEEIPLAYLPGNALRVHVRVVGDLP